MNMYHDLADYYIKDKAYNEIQKNKIEEYIRYRKIIDAIIFIMKDHNEYYLERLYNIGNNYIRKFFMQFIINENTFCRNDDDFTFCLTRDDEIFVFDVLKYRMQCINAPPTPDDLNDRLGLFVDLFLRIYDDYDFQYNIEDEYIQYLIKNYEIEFIGLGTYEPDE